MVQTGKLLKPVVLMVAFIFLGCDRGPTQPKMGRLSGRVTLEGQSNHQGITIGAYPLASIPQELKNIFQQHSGIGFPPSQATEFDHRFSVSSASALTDTGGYFNLGVEEGYYNLVARKTGFGWRYSFAVQVVSEQNNDIGNVRLFSEQILSNIGSPFTLQRYHHYLVNSNILITAPLTIEAGAVIRLGNLVTVDVTVGFSGLPPTDSLFYILGDFSDTSSKWDRFNFNVQDTSAIFRNVVIRQGYEGIRLTNYPGRVENARISRCETGIKMSSGGNVRIAKTLISNTSLVGIDLTISSHATIDRSVFYNNLKAIGMNTAFLDSLSDCYFLSNGTGIDMYQSTGIVQRTVFQSNNPALRTQGGATGNTNFLDVIGDVFLNNGMYGIAVYSNSSLTIHQNNFLNTSNYSLGLVDRPSFPVFDAENNWWNTTNTSVIQSQKIRNTWQAQGYQVDFQPFLFAPNPSAGIQ